MMPSQHQTAAVESASVGLCIPTSRGPPESIGISLAAGSSTAVAAFTRSTVNRSLFPSMHFCPGCLRAGLCRLLRYYLWPIAAAVLPTAELSSVRMSDGRGSRQTKAPERFMGRRTHSHWSTFCQWISEKKLLRDSTRCDTLLFQEGRRSQRAGSCCKRGRRHPSVPQSPRISGYMNQRGLEFHVHAKVMTCGDKRNKTEAAYCHFVIKTWLRFSWGHWRFTKIQRMVWSHMQTWKRNQRMEK